MPSHRLTLLLAPLPAHKQAQDARQWERASCEAGGWTGVLWGEVRQLWEDVRRVAWR